MRAYSSAVRDLQPRNILNFSTPPALFRTLGHLRFCDGFAEWTGAFAVHPCCLRQEFARYLPDYRVKIGTDLLETDRWANLRHGLQDMDGMELRSLPQRKSTIHRAMRLRAIWRIREVAVRLRWGTTPGDHGNEPLQAISSGTDPDQSPHPQLSLRPGWPRHPPSGHYGVPLSDFDVWPHPLGS
jgi:hypothetical protein